MSMFIVKVYVSYISCGMKGSNISSKVDDQRVKWKQWSCMFLYIFKPISWSVWKSMAHFEKKKELLKFSKQRAV